MALYKADGIVIRTRNLGEADRIVTLYTAFRGKVDAVANGVRRTRSRLAGPTQLFTHGRYLLFSGRNLHRISQVDIAESFAFLREDLVKMAYASYVAELTDALTEPGEPTESAGFAEMKPSVETDGDGGVAGDAVFRLLVETFHALNEADSAALAVRRFEMRFMHDMGYSPHLESCVGCGGSPGADLRLSAKEGGLLCSACLVADTTALRVNGATVEWMKRLRAASVRQLGVYKLSPSDEDLLRHACRIYIDYRLSRPLKSLAFLNTLNNMA